MKRIPLFLILLLSYSSANATTIFVTTTVDDLDFSNGTCTLREAIIAANINTPIDACPAGSDGNFFDDIYFLESGSINLIAALPSITDALRIRGPGPDYLSIDANGFGRVFELTSGNSQISGVEIRGGYQGGHPDAIGEGAGIFIASAVFTTTLFDCRITDNEADRGAGIYVENGANLRMTQTTVSNNIGNADGAGIYTESGSSTVIRASTISGNYTNDGQHGFGHGGGIHSKGQLLISNSTISGNSAEDDGGAIYFDASDIDDKLLLHHNTITDNRAGTDGSGGNTGGLHFHLGQELDIRNNIIAGNFDDSFADGHWRDIALISLIELENFGYNLIGENTNPGAAFVFPSGNPNANDDYVGSPIDLMVPNLSPLQDAGGPTMVHPVIFTILDNTIIDKGSCLFGGGVGTEEFDQLGRAGDTLTPSRPIDQNFFPNTGDTCDIGSVEYGPQKIPSNHSFDVLLDGPYVNVIMDTDLNESELIPLIQPYNEAPWNYSGSEHVDAISNDMVDWVLVSFSKGGPLDAGGWATTTREAYVLEDNGSIVNSDYDLNFQAVRLDPGYYWVTIEHRNHLAVTSNIPLFFNRHETSPSHDFTADLSSAFTSGGLAMRQRGSDFTMWGGNGNGDENVTAFDFLNIWLPANGGPLGYHDADFNLDGSATAFDFLEVWLPANGQAAQIP